MPHFSLKHSIVAVVLAAFLAVNVVQVPVVFAEAISTYGVDEKGSDLGLMGADVKDAHDLVAIVVSEDVWNDSQKYAGLSEKYNDVSKGKLQDRVKRYAEDVQKALPKTNTIIIPVSGAADSVLKVQQVLEKLYLGGQKVNGNATQLSGVVLVGNVPLPVVTKGSQAFISVLPYTDFVEPSYVFDAKLQQFVRSPSAPAAPKAEIWHGVIHAPVKGIQGMGMLAEYFDKNHLYHIGNKDFSEFGKKILYDDLIAESKNMNRASFPRYQQFLKEMEDIVYSRFSSKWLAALQKQFDVQGGAGAPPTTDIPDIQTVQPIQSYHLSYPELFGTLLGSIADYATGSGRWSEDDVESMPSLIAKKDAYMMQTIRETNDAIEAKIDVELEAVQKPLPLYRDATVEGVVRYQNPGKIGLLKSIASTLAGNITSKDYLIGGGKFVFTNNSVIAGIQYVNGVASGDIVRAQQCSTYGGSVSGDGGLSQMVRYIRSLNPLTINVSGATGAAGESDNAKNPGLLPTLGITTRALSSSEASKLTQGNILHGAIVEADKNLGLPAKFAAVSLNQGDILLDLDGATIDEEHPVPSLLMTRSVGQTAHVSIYRDGKTLSVPTTILDANSDALVAGCYGINFTNEQNVIAGKEKRRCFPLASTYPIADHAGTVHVDSIAGLSDMDRGLSCTSFHGQKQFDTFIDEARKYLSDSRGNGPSGLTLPNLPTQDPSKILLLDKKGIFGAPQDFSFQQFLDLQGIMNVQDDNGDYSDTNANGKVDQTAWIDYNGNGKLDLWVNPGVTGSSVNVVSLPGEDDPLSVLFGKLPLSLSVEEYKTKFPQFFQGSKYIGPYTGEFVGGDFGVDDPSEIGFGYKPLGTSEAERWGNIQKKYLEIEQPVVYATPRRAPTQQEYRAHLQAMLKNHPSLKLDALNLLYGGSSCIASGTGCEDEALQIEGLRKSTSDIWMRFTALKEKDISSVGYYKEPTAATLGAQFKGVLSSALPIDKPRHATFLDSLGSMKTFIYPNAFSVSTYDELVKKLGESEKSLAEYGDTKSNGLLTSMFSPEEAKKIQSILEWRGLSLDQKHMRAMSEYLNPSIDGYVDDSPLGYEAMYFVADGKPTSYTTDFSGEGLITEDDPEYMSIMGGDNIKGQGNIVASATSGVSIDTSTSGSSAPAAAVAAASESTPAPTETKSSATSSPVDSSNPDVVDIDKWFPAIEKWLDDIKNSFKPLGLSLTHVGGYDSLVAPGAPLQTLKISLPKADLIIGGDSVAVDVIGFDAKGSLATNDHTSLVRLDVAGLDSSPESAKVIPDASDMPDGGIYLSQGHASFQIVPGKKAQTIVVRAHATVSGASVASDSTTLHIAEAGDTVGTDALLGVPHSVTLSSDNGMLIAPAVLPALPQAVSISLSDIGGHPVEGQLASYDITVNGPVSVSGVNDLDSSREGYQIQSMGQPIKILLTPTAQSGQVTISASSLGDDGSPMSSTLTLPIRSDLHLVVSSNVPQLKADNGTSVAIVTATVRDAGGAVVPTFSGPVHFSIDDDKLGTFSSKTPTNFSKGQAVVTLKSNTRSGNVNVLVDGSGLPSTKTSIEILPLQAAGIQIINGTKTLALAAGANIVVNIVDQYGNLASENSLPLQVRLTAKTEKYGNLRSANGTLSKTLIAYAQHGAGAFTVQASDVSGLIHIVVSSPGLNGAAHEITTSGVSGNGIISSLNPSVLYASLLGGPFGEVSEQNYLAGSMLFSGKMEAAAALSADSKPLHNLISLGAYGGVTVFDSAAAVRVLTSGKGEPLRMSLATDIGKNTVGELIIKRDGKASDYVSMTPTEGDTYSFAATGPSNYDGIIRDAEKDLLYINGTGGVQVLDPKITVTLSPASSLSSSKFISLDVSSDSSVIATIHIPFDAVNSLALLNAPPASYQQLPTGVWLVNQIHTGDYIFAPSYTGFSSEEPMGYKLVSTLTTDITASDSIGSSSISLEDASTTGGIGFAGDNKHMLLLAAGNTVGESHKPYPSEIGIVLGDPTVRLPGTNAPSAMGFSMDLGKSIGSITQGAKVLLPLDVNNDGKKDLLVGNEDGSIRYFQYTGGSETFRDRGELLRIKHGIYDAGVADIDGDGDEDIVIATKESCTTKETCVDIYRNNKGSFTRENLGLAIEPDRRVAVMRLVDLNADGVPDLLVSLTNGEIRAFYNDGKGVFEHTGQLIGSFNVSPGQRVLLSAGTSIAQSINSPGDVTLASDAHDSFADIFAQPEGSANAMLVYFVANGASSLKGGHVMYRKIEVPAGISTSDAMDKLKGDLSATLSPKDATGAKSQLAAAGQGMSLLMNENNKDANHDGVPDYIDGSSGGDTSITVDGAIAKAGAVVNSVKSTIKKLRCGEGCLPLPVNFAFLAPGPINVNGKAVGDDPLAIPVFGAAGGCTPWPIWPPCPYQNTAQTFRIYVSPTLTGQVGFGICWGGSYKNAKCAAFAPNITFIPKDLCKAISQKMNAVLKNASSFGSGGGGSGSGFTTMISGGGKKFPSTDTSNTHTNKELLQGYGVEANVSSNIRIPGFPSAFTDWIDRQIEEILDKLTDLPDLYLMYPDLSSVGRAVIPQMSSGKIAGYSTFLAWLNSVPLIQIEPKPVLLILPSLTKGQILKLQANLGLWLNDLTLEMFRVKSLFGCEKQTKDKRYIDICGLIDVKGNLLFKKINDIFKTLDAYKDFPKKLLQYRNIESKYISQIINYLTTISQFLGGYIRRQEKRLGAWVDMIKSVKKALGQWQYVIDVTQKYAENCDSCKTERGSLFPLLLNKFVNIPPPPIIAFPKWPDIIMDFSRVQTGVNIVWPDLTFAPKQIILPTLPSIKLPIDINLLAELGGLDKLSSVNISKITIDLSATFDSYIPVLPALPAVPSLPNLPDLPPLPAFKLPDIPPAPRIPGLDKIKGGSLSKSLASIKDLLEIVCLVKKGYVIVDEDNNGDPNKSNLKTMIEQLTQRSLTPPLSIDLGVSVSYPPITYNAVEQVILRGKFKFELGTDVIYKTFKSFADSVNSETTDLVRGVNSLGEQVGKGAKNVTTNANTLIKESITSGASALKDTIKKGTTEINTQTQNVNSTTKNATQDVQGKLGSFNSDESQIHLVAEQASVDITKLPLANGDNNTANASSALSHQLQQYLADRTIEMPDLSSGIIASTIPLSRYMAQASAGDTVPDSSGSRMVALATGSSGGTTETGTGTAPAIAGVMSDYADNAAQPVGIFLSNPATGNAEKLLSYTRETGRDPVLNQTDVDGDGDTDVFYSFGGDIYFKENQTKQTSDVFNQVDTSSPMVSSLNDLLPTAGAVNGISFDDSQHDLITLSWNASVGSIGYELDLWSMENGLQKRQYLLPVAGGQIPYNASVVTEEIPEGDSVSISLSLPYGNTYFQIVPLGAKGAKGTPSSVYLFAPQICGDSTPPLSSVEGGVGGEGTGGAGDDIRSVAVGKTLSINLSGIIDVKSQIVKYYADSDLSKDSNGDGNPENDYDLSSTLPSLTFGPYFKSGDVQIKVFAENAHGEVSQQTLGIRVYVPNISLKHASAQDGSANGYISPGEGDVPFSLVRERGGSAEIVGDYVTDSVGNFSVSGLQAAGKTVIRNMKNEVVAEYESETGKFHILMPGYTLRARVSAPAYLATVEVVDPHDTVLASSFAVPDANTDVTNDPASLLYTPTTVGAMKGVHVADRDDKDSIVLKNIPADDPAYFGGTEIIRKDASGDTRLALIDSSAHIFISNEHISIRLRDVADMPYAFEILLDSKVIGEIFIATKIPLKPIVLDPTEFSIPANASVDAQVAAIPLASLVPPSHFSDIAKGTDLYNAVSILQSDGIIEGYQENGQQVFKPDQAILRAEYTKIVLKALCIVPRASAYQAPSPFSDISHTEPPSWFYPFVKESFLLNLITGYIGERNAYGFSPFKPLAYISRAESVKILIEALRMLRVIHLDSVKVGPNEAWYAPFMKVGQNLMPYTIAPTTSASAKAKESFIVTPSESQSPNYRMTRGDFAIMAARVLETYDCYKDVRDAKLKKLQEDMALQQKAAQDSAQKNLDAKRSAAFTQLQKTLSQKTSKLSPGIYVFLPICNSCPCASVIDNTGQLLPGDRIFAIISTKDHATILKKSNIIVLPILQTSP